MTATKKQASEVVREIPLDQLHVSPAEVRKTIDPRELADLAASIEQQGVIEALLVRPIDLDCMSGEPLPGAAKVGDAFEIVSGQRRHAAATLAGKTSCPCIVREMSDAEAAEARIVANLQRKDVSALEEAQAIGKLLETLGTIAAVAARLGKEQSYIAKRLKLLTLTLCSCDALREGLITIDHALLLARLAAEEQDAALKWCLDPQAGAKTSVDTVIEERLKARRTADDLPDDDTTELAVRRARWNHEWEPQSVQRLKEHIECESGIPLDRAPWPLDDGSLLPDVGACVDCPQNTKANAPLFGDLDIGVAVCTDGGCFKAKTEQFVHLQGSKVARPPLGVLRVSWKSTTTAPRMCKDTTKCPHGQGPNLLQLFKAGQWVEAKKACDRTRSAVTVDWSDAGDRGYMGRDEKLRKPGEILQACIEPKCKLHPKAYEKAKSQGGRDPEAEKAAEEKRKAAAIVEGKLRMAVASKALETISAIPGGALRAIGLMCAPSWGRDVQVANALMPGLKKTLQDAPVASAEFAKALFVVSLNNLSVSEYSGASEGREQFLASIKRCGVTPDNPWKQPAKPKVAAKAAAKATPVPAKKVAVSPETKKQIQAAVKKRWAKTAVKKAAKSGGKS